MARGYRHNPDNSYAVINEALQFASSGMSYEEAKDMAESIDGEVVSVEVARQLKQKMLGGGNERGRRNPAADPLGRYEALRRMAAPSGNASPNERRMAQMLMAQIEAKLGYSLAAPPADASRSANRKGAAKAIAARLHLENSRRNPSEYWKGNLQKSVKEGLNRRDYLFGDTSSAQNDRDLSGANLEGADLATLNLAGANLRGAHLSYAHMEQVDLEGADLVNAELLGAKLQDSRLSGANMSNAHMDNVTLTRANLVNANLSGASLLGADLTYANLSGANLTGAQMRGANLKGAIMDGATMPDGTRHQ